MGFTWSVSPLMGRPAFPTLALAFNGALTRTVYDGDAILLEYDGADVLQARYSHGEEIDQPLAMARDLDADGQLAAAEQFFYHTDHLGSVRLLTDAAGVVANRYDYDAFGNLEATSFETVTNPFDFTARERDAESGLMFYRARYYDPEVGRFISEDPIGFDGEDLNLYRYVLNSPVNYSDETGNFISEEALGSLLSQMVVRYWLGALIGFGVTGDECLAQVAALAGAISPVGSFLAPIVLRVWIAEQVAIASAAGATLSAGGVGAIGKLFVCAN